jgi:hypothetical protein
VLGPTGHGKSALGLALAERYGGGSSAATRRPSTEASTSHRQGAHSRTPRHPHHLVDVADPADIYTAAQYARDASAAVVAIHGRGRLPILVGGTGFYYRALTRGLFPGRATGTCARGSGASPERVESPFCIAWSDWSIPRRRHASSRETGCGSSAPSRDVFPHGPAADRALRRDRVAARPCRSSRWPCACPQRTCSAGSRAAWAPVRRRALDECEGSRARRAGGRPAVSRPGLPPGAGLLHLVAPRRTRASSSSARTGATRAGS